MSDAYLRFSIAHSVLSFNSFFSISVIGGTSKPFLATCHDAVKHNFNVLFVCHLVSFYIMTADSSFCTLYTASFLAAKKRRRSRLLCIRLRTD